MIKIVYLSTVFSSYHLARLKDFQNRFNIEIFCVELVGGGGETKIPGWRDENRADFGRRIRTIFPENSYADLSSHKVYHGIGKEIKKMEPSVLIVPGWSSATALSGIYWSSVLDIKTIIVSDSFESNHGFLSYRKILKKVLLLGVNSGLVAGSVHKKYLESLGFCEQQIFDGYDVVDNSKFSTTSLNKFFSIVDVKKKYDLPDNYLLAVGRLIPEKNYISLLKGFKKYLDSTPSYTVFLVIVGDGDEREKIENITNELGINELVKLIGSVPHEEMVGVYGLATALVLASISETWGLVVNEAMASGLPILLSNKCGCSNELVVDGKNGFIFNPYSTDSIANSIHKILVNIELSDTFSEESTKMIEAWGLDRFSVGLKSAIEYSLARNKRATVPTAILSRIILLLK